MDPKRSAFACFKARMLCKDEFGWKREKSVRFIRTGITTLRLKSRSKNLLAKTDRSTCRIRLCSWTSPEIGSVPGSIKA